MNDVWHSEVTDFGCVTSSSSIKVCVIWGYNSTERGGNVKEREKFWNDLERVVRANENGND